MHTPSDIIIVGGGPSGSIAGILLERLGYHTCILEKSSFPRHKTCGGMLTQKAVDLLSVIFPDGQISKFYEFTVHRINFYYKEKKITSITTKDPLYQTNRYLFDDQLIRHYKESGGTVIENVAFKPGMRTSPYTLSVPGYTLSYKILLGADGALSQVRKLIEPSVRPDTFCLDVEIPFGRINRDGTDVDIVLGYTNNGYGWNFPKRGYFNLGLGGEMKKNKNLLMVFREFADANYSLAGPIRPNGGFLFTCHYVTKPFLDNEILLTGDAAGLTEPVTGEGIYFAISSGQFAAEAIDGFLSGKVDHLGGIYLDKLQGTHRLFRQALFMQRIFFIPFITRLFMNHIRRRNHIAVFYADNTLSSMRLSYFQVIPAYLKRKWIYRNQ
jgi:geranylgeranyl reductase family protein